MNNNINIRINNKNNQCKNLISKQLKIKVTKLIYKYHKTQKMRTNINILETTTTIIYNRNKNNTTNISRIEDTLIM